MAPTKHILVLLFSSNYTVCIYSLSSLLPFMIDMYTMIIDVHMWESILGCLEISSDTTINLKHFNLFSGKFLGQGQKAAHSLQKNVTRIVSKSLTNILLFCNSWSCPLPMFQITLQDFLCDYKGCSVKSFNCFSSSKSHKSPTNSLVISVMSAPWS